jgi:hypothetical protein
MSGNVSGFPKQKTPAEELENIQVLQDALSKDEMRLVMAYRKLVPLSTLKVSVRQGGKIVDIVITHQEFVPLDGRE